MKRLLSVLLAFVATLALAAIPSFSSGAASPWKLVVNDQFSSGGVPGHWSRYDSRYGSGAKNCARPDQAVVKGGTMRMILRHRSSGDCGSGWYSAGMMLTKRLASVDQKISVRFRVASNQGVRGHRIIPMRWPSTGSWPDAGEEDYCETSGLRECSTFLHSAHDQESRSYRVDLTKWHVMTFVRRNFTVSSYIDGKRRWTFHGNGKTLPATAKRPVLQQECDSSCPSGTAGSEVIYVDWVKIWNPS